MRQFGIAAKLLSKVYETLLTPETCEQEEVGEFKGVTFKIAKSQTPLAELGRAYNPLRVTTVYATGVLACLSPWRIQAVTGCLGTVVINIARSRHKMYPVSSPVGGYGPYGRTKRPRGLERLPVRTSECACALQTADQF